MTLNWYCLSVLIFVYAPPQCSRSMDSPSVCVSLAERKILDSKTFNDFVKVIYNLVKALSSSIQRKELAPIPLVLCFGMHLIAPSARAFIRGCHGTGLGEDYHVKQLRSRVSGHI